jgi:hypothetical protein
MSFMLLALTVLVCLTAITWAWQYRRSPRRHAEPEAQSTWRLVLPREAHFGVAEVTAWFASLAPHLPDTGPYPTVELRSEGRTVVIHVTIPRPLEAVLRGQLAAWFPGARLESAAEDEPRGVLTALPLRLEKPDLYPLRVSDVKGPDPLLGLLGVLAHADDTCGLRLTWGPTPKDWRRWASLALQAVEKGQRVPPRGTWLWLYLLYQFFRQGAAPASSSARRPPISAPELTAAAVKAREPVFGTQLVVWAAGPTRAVAAQRVTGLAEHLRAGFRHPFGNVLAVARHPNVTRSLRETENLPNSVMALSAAELAALFHLPSTEHPLLPGEISRRVPPPVHLFPPETAQERITVLGEALTPEGPKPFGLTHAERRLHLYLVGQTGTGKSTLLSTLAAQDLAAGRGLGVIDPHGDLARQVLALVPPERAGEVLYFNPADTDYPVGFNLLAATSPSERTLVASGVISAFRRLFQEYWGPRLEYIFRNALLVLLETPSPSLLTLPRLLTERSYRQHVLPYVHDPILRHFLTNEFEAYDARWRAEAVSPILNKLGHAFSSPLVRHIVGQSRPGFRLREVMDRGGIFVANLAVGQIGEDAADLLGGLLLAGFHLAALSRANQPEEQRRDFFLSVDEFQHFGTDSFAALLAESRKFGLSLTLSHQYLQQLPPGMVEAVLGNAASLGVFRVGAPDAGRLVRELAPRFDGQDLVHQPNHQFAARLTRGGEPLPAFSARTLPPAAEGREIGSLIESSRRRWARPRAEVELEIADLWEGRVD